MADRGNKGSNASSSAVKVLQCDYLLIEILLRLPQKSVFRCKCVSRRWNDITSDPYFRRRYISEFKSSMLGFFYGTDVLRSRFPKEKWGPPLSFVSTCEEGKSIISHNFMKEVGFFVGGVSSGGLILCGFHSVTYYVCNPITNQWLPLPKPRMNNHGCVIGFSSEGCSDDGVIHFLVIRVGLDMENIRQIEMFSSRTGEWRESVLTCQSTVSLEPYTICKVVGGVFYWLAYGENFVHFIAAYDPNMGKDHLWLISLPGDTDRVGPMVQTPDGLLQCAVANQEGFSVWVLRRKLSDYSFPNTIKSSEWIFRSNVKYTDLSLKGAKIMNLATNSYIPRAWRLRLTAFHPGDSRIVYFLLGLKICCYNLETQSLELVKYHGKAQPSRFYKLYPYVQCALPGRLPLIGTEKLASRSDIIQRKRFTCRRNTPPAAF